MTGLLESFAQTWWGWIGPMSLQIALLALVIVCVDRLAARRVWPQLRHALWLLVPLKLLLPTTLASPVGVGEIVSMAAAPAVDSAGADLAIAGSSNAWPLGLGAIWATGLIVLCAAAWWRRRVHRRRLESVSVATPAWVHEAVRDAARSLGLRREPRVLLSFAVASPAVTGVLRPVVLLPGARAAARRTRLGEHALEHELAHVRRRDLLWQAAFDLASAVFWFHPMLWIARSRSRDLRELCCDATVAATLGDRAPEYRDTLLDAAREMVTGAPGGVALGFLGGGCHVLSRLRWLDRGSWRRPVRRRAASIAAIVVMAACVLPMGHASIVPASVTSHEAEIASARERLRAAIEEGSSLRIRYAAQYVMNLEAADTR